MNRPAGVVFPLLRRQRMARIPRHAARRSRSGPRGPRTVRATPGAGRSAQRHVARSEGEASRSAFAPWTHIDSVVRRTILSLDHGSARPSRCRRSCVQHSCLFGMRRLANHTWYIDEDTPRCCIDVPLALRMLHDAEPWRSLLSVGACESVRRCGEHDRQHTRERVRPSLDAVEFDDAWLRVRPLATPIEDCRVEGFRTMPP